MQSPITPVTIFPSKADTLVVDSFNGIPLNYRWALCRTDIVTAAADAVGEEGDEDYSPAVEEVTRLEPLTQGNGSLTRAQWTAWKTQSDEPYVLACVAANLGVKLA